MTENDPDKPKFLQRYGFALGAVAVVGTVVALFASQALSHHGGPARRVQQVTIIKLAPPPPPPMPKPPEQKLPDDRMIEQAPVDDKEQKPDDKPKDANPASQLGTNIKGDGPADAFGLGGGGGYFGGSNGGSSGSRWGWYASEVQVAIGEALRRNAHTRDSSFRVEIRIWPDITGRITRTRLVGSTGDPAIDEAIKNEVLAGFQLPEPPPPGMPRPIVLRIAARRPN